MIEYKEVKTKKGKHLIFCDFRELLMEFYKVGTYEEVIPYAKKWGTYNTLPIL
jgi:hypothetical protein